MVSFWANVFSKPSCQLLSSCLPALQTWILAQPVIDPHCITSLGRLLLTCPGVSFFGEPARRALVKRSLAFGNILRGPARSQEDRWAHFPRSVRYTVRPLGTFRAVLTVVLLGRLLPGPFSWDTSWQALLCFHDAEYFSPSALSSGSGRRARPPAWSAAFGTGVDDNFCCRPANSTSLSGRQGPSPLGISLQEKKVPDSSHSSWRCMLKGRSPAIWRQRKTRPSPKLSADWRPWRILHQTLLTGSSKLASPKTGATTLRKDQVYFCPFSSPHRSPADSTCPSVTGRKSRVQIASAPSPAVQPRPTRRCLPQR